MSDSDTNNGDGEMLPGNILCYTAYSCCWLNY